MCSLTSSVIETVGFEINVWLLKTKEKKMF